MKPSMSRPGQYTARWNKESLGPGGNTRAPRAECLVLGAVPGAGVLGAAVLGAMMRVPQCDPLTDRPRAPSRAASRARSGAAARDCRARPVGAADGAAPRTRRG